MSDRSGVCTIVPRGQEGFRPHVIGMGILLDAREIVTCAHVIDEALGKGWQRRSSEPGRVSICFPLADGAPCVEGTVDDRRWFPPGMTGRGEPSDIAFIQLDEDAPTSAERAALKNHSNSEAKAYGFRGKEVDGGWLSHPYGDWVYGRIAGTLPGGRMQFDGVNREGATVERGYSGAGVYVQDSDSVVGMIVEKDREKNTAQFIDVPSLKKARGRQAASPRAARREAPPALVASARKKKTELEEYLRAVGAALPEPDPDAGLLPYLEPILKKDDEPAHTLRAAFGFPRAVTVSRSIYNLAAGSEPSMRPLLGILAQRLNHLLWRFEFTLEVIPEEWAAEYMARSQALKAICEPHLVAKQPTLRDVSAALRLTKDLKAFTESAPDPILYAVLRSFSSSEEPLPQGDGSDSLSDEDVALDFLFDYLSRLLDGQWQIDDSSNAWWAVRTGIWAGDPRFRGLLTRVANKYYDITVPREDVSRLAAVPEIYKPIRTSSYTLSNAQAIVEHEVALDDALKEQLRQVIYRMRERLSNTPHSKQLYLASVHHEGFRNYLDYVADQEQEVGGADSAGGAGVTAEK